MEIQFDPTEHYTVEGQNNRWLLGACGFIPYFFEAISKDIISHETSAEGVMGLMMQEYGFPTEHRMTGEVKADGRYVYPEDPDLYPYVCLSTKGVNVYIYPYGIVAVQTDKDLSIARMD